MIKSFTWFTTVVLLLASCKKEGEVFTVTEGTFPASALSSTSGAVVLTQATENETAVTFNWLAADFGKQPVIAYTLQLDVPGDTAGTDGWSNATIIIAGNNVLTYSFITKDLNSILNGLGMIPGTAQNFVARIKAEVPQNNGTPSSLAPIYSNILALTITSYGTSLYVPGDYQGWDPPSAPLLNTAEGKPGMYEGYVYMPNSGLQYFKYTSSPDWDHINYGDGGNGTLTTDGLAAGLSVPDGGYYEVTANLNDQTWTATKTTWGIIGDASPGGWTTDTQMSYDEVNQIWTVTLDMIHNGSFKFRANNEWVIDFGIDADGNIQYADNPFFGYNPDLSNLTVPEDGNYTITLDLHISGIYSFTMSKN